MERQIYKGNHQNGEIEIIEERSVFKNRYMEIFNDDVLFPSGVKGTYIRAASNNDMSIGVLPVTEEGRIVLIRTFRHGVRGWGYEIPKGEALIGEKGEIAARRELYEETGITPEKLIYMGELCESPAVFSGRMKCYIALNCQYAGEKEPEDTEAISGTREFDAEEYLLGQDGCDFTDAVTQLMVYKYMALRRK
ncbi:MAG: NUDIX hydrolase [Ruminococcus sp.]|nr:NUDIX hydrolase [Ruminococcus sp.]